MRRFPVRRKVAMPDEMYEAPHRLSVESGRSMASIARDAVERYIRARAETR